jgi:hypothetical protein
VSHRAGLDGCGKSRLPPGFDLLTVQPVANRYNDCAIAADDYSQKIPKILRILSRLGSFRCVRSANVFGASLIFIGCCPNRSTVYSQDTGMCFLAR